MTTKILTLRVPSKIYARLCQDAGEKGVSISAHVRTLVEREHEVDQIENVRHELLNRINQMAELNIQTALVDAEVVLMCRAIATHLNPQLVAQTLAKLKGMTSIRGLS